MSLTQREFLFLDDLLHHEEAEVKCCLDFARRTQDPQIKQTFLSLARQHQQHFDRLLDFLGQSQQTTFGTESRTAPSRYGQPAFAGTGSPLYSSTASNESDANHIH